MNRGDSGANLPALRSHNAALVLDLLRAAGEGGISRLELAERTGLTPQAVSKITARLRQSGLAAEAGRRASTGGKPRTVLRLVRGARSAVGLHLDRDELTAALTDVTGQPVAVRRVPFDFGAGEEAVLRRAVTEVRELLRDGSVAASGRSYDRETDTPDEGGAAASHGPEADGLYGSDAGGLYGSDAGELYGPEAGGSYGPDAGGSYEAAAGASPESATGPSSASALGPVIGVGVACPGPLDHRSGVLGRVTGLPQWEGFPLRDALAARLGLPVVLDKDTNAAALGVALRRAEPGAHGGKRRDRSADGDLAEGGDSGEGGEGGHLGGSEESGEGGRRAHESFAYLHVGTGLGAGLVLGGGLYRGSRTAAGEFGHQVIQLDGPPCECGGRGCIEALCLAAVARGDTEHAARVLGTGAADLVGLLDIDRVLLGGRIAVADAEVFVRGMAAVVAERAEREGAGAGRTVPVSVAPDGERAVVLGAAQLVLAPLFGRAEPPWAAGHAPVGAPST
ncbi:ROK family transcriptional regulator [Streptomyces sp. NPDC051776]|uniref:ROK family transcriptional regulator n=1 Tax=Streptomyces sp. NPDC051776 TaxID=3155414 RepID=UPI0034136430